MFFEILKRDLKRKKTMNFIIFIFVVMSVTFVCSSVTNLSATLTSLDDYFEMAGVGDYVAIERADRDGKSAKDIADGLDYVKDIKVEEVLYNTDAIINKDGESIVASDIVLVSSFDRRIEKYFVGDNIEITYVPQGGAYLRQSVLEALKTDIGDTITVTIDGTSKQFKVLGLLKDAVFGGSLMSTPRIVINEADYRDFLKGENIELYKGRISFFYTDDTESLSKALAECTSLSFMDTSEVLKLTYLLEMAVAAIMMVLSICLIIIALIILKFTISFTISEEFREIGIMKAIGIPNNGIRGLYLVKYFFMSVIGAVIGFIMSFLFSDLLMEKTRQTILISDKGSVVLSIISALAVVSIVMLFGFRSTKIIKKFSPIDAIRNGTTGERYKKKGILKLSGSGLRPVAFIAVNDVLSGIRRFILMFIIFTIGILMVMINVNIINTLKSGKLVKWFGVTESEVYLTSTKNIKDYHNDRGEELLKEELENIRKTVTDNGMPCETRAELVFKYSVKNGDIAANSLTFLGVNTTTDQYDNYVEGSAPANPNELALNYRLMEKLDAHIGDKITLTDQDGSKEYIISGTIETMTNMGEGIRLHQDDKRNYSYMNGVLGTQIKFTDAPTKAEVNRRIEKIKTLLPEYTVMTADEFTDYIINSASYLGNTKNIVVLVVILINILVAVLMEKSFLTKERGEIAMLKAIGFKDGSIVLWQTLRISLVMLAATVVSIIINNPVHQLTGGAVFKIMGAKKMIFDPNILESYVIYPLIILAATLFGVVLTALSVRHISANEINSIE